MEGGIDASSAGSSTHLRANFFFASTPKLASVKVMSGLALRWSSPKVLCGGHAAPQRPKSVDGGQHTPHGTPYPSGANDVGQATICLSSGSCWVGSTSRMPGRDRKSTRLTPVTDAHLVCRLLLENKQR